MTRPKKAIRSIEKTICLPEPLVNKIDLILFSQVEGRVPFGAWQKFLVRALEQYLQSSSIGNSNE